MIGDAELNPRSAPKRKRASPLLKNALGLITRHWKGKLVCLLVAIFVWGYMIGQDDTLTRDKTFHDVPVTVSNRDTLLRNGLIVVSGLEDLTLDRVIVETPQKTFSTVTAANYNLRVDLSRIREAGEQDLPVLYTSTTTYGSVTAMSQSSLHVVVEDYISRYRIPVRLVTTGGAPDELFLGDPTVSPSSVNVSGPRSQVERVARCLVTYDLSTLSGQIGQERSAVPFTLVDIEGNAVSSSLITVTSEQVELSGVTVEQAVSYRRDLPVDALNIVTGTPAEGYEIKLISFQPKTISVGGTLAAIEEFDAAMLASSVDVTGATSTVRRRLSVTKFDELMLKESTVMVTVQIEPIEVSRFFGDIAIEPVNLAEGLSAILSETTSGVRVIGPMLLVNALEPDQCRLLADLGGLSEGVYEIPLTCVCEAAHESMAFEALSVTVSIQAR